MDTQIEHVADTAYLVAHHRAVESARRKPLFIDPFAAQLAGEYGPHIAAQMPTSAMTGWSVALRTVIIDDFVLEAIAAGVGRILNLGAGLDTRPWRMELPPALQWVEVDYPHVLAAKAKVLAQVRPRCQLESVPLDLADRPARQALLARLDSDEVPLLVLTEGVLPYLTVPAVGELAEDLHRLRQLRGWLVDYVSPESIAYRQRAGVTDAMRKTPFLFTPPDWQGFFASHAFDVRTLNYLADAGQRLHRPPPLPWLARVVLGLGRRLRPGAGQEGFRRSMGYAWLQPVVRDNPA